MSSFNVILKYCSINSVNDCLVIKYKTTNPSTSAKQIDKIEFAYIWLIFSSKLNFARISVEMHKST